MAQKTAQSLSSRGRFWRKHVEQWQRSGATQVQYCKEHHLSIAAFRWWRRKLTPGRPAEDSPKELLPTPVPSFTEIRIPEGGAAATAYPFLLDELGHLSQQLSDEQLAYVTENCAERLRGDYWEWCVYCELMPS